MLPLSVLREEISVRARCIGFSEDDVKFKRGEAA
jgi:hypothetical protein